MDRELLIRMNRTMIHRGPDDEGYYCRDNAGLGHRRLSIIDLNSGHQPIYNEDKTKVIVFNGEIYNFLELRSFLQKEGHTLQTKTDTEVIIHAYEQWGAECVQKLRGMFSFAVWDTKKQELFLARDRLGKKPLYYSCDGTKIIFASELKGILEDHTVARDINIEALSDYLSFGYVPYPKTIFRSILKLPPGHFLLNRDHGSRPQQYWDITFAPTLEFSEDELCDSLLTKLQEAVKMRLISDVPLGAFLSGGIDSSIVVALMSQLTNEPVITNSVGFTQKKYSELEHAGFTASLFGTNHHEFVVAPDAVDVVNRLAWHFDEPFADSSAIPTYYVSKMARNNVTVALSGDGGDENFAGYRRYFFDRLENRLRAVFPLFLRRSVIRALATVYPKADWLPQVMRAKTLLTNLSLDPVEGYFNSMSYFLPSAKDKVISPELAGELRDYESSELFRRHYGNAGTSDPLSRIQYIDFKTYLTDDILTKVDRASMAVSLEVRVPILDHEFVELAAMIPSCLKLNGRVSKYIFKKTAERLLPPNILNRQKMGFSIPVGEWLRNELKPLVHETILSKEFEGRLFFNQKYVQWLWKQHLAGIRDFTQPLWVLLSFELWARRFL
ncbi:MAG: asparagine synthase (glutamine-hydrolyzing) [Syntrophaceae bacterium]|nr:asparagine synthase (glutamine-hydrolyzing) [Syntrophaceae bacterium]